MRGADHAHIDRDLGPSPEPLDHSFLEKAEQLCLQGQGEIPNFIQKKGTPLSIFDASDRLFGGTGKRTFFVSEQFAFQQIFGDGGAVDSHQALFRPWAQVMGGTREEFLASSAFPVNQDGDFRGSHPFDGLAQLLHHRIVRQYPLQWRGGLQGFQGRIFCFQTMQGKCTLQDECQHLGLKGFLAKIIGAHRHCLNCIFSIRISRQYDDFGRRHQGQQFLQCFQPLTHTLRVGRKPQIQQRHFRLETPQTGDGLRPTPGHLQGKPLQLPAQLFPKTEIILNQ